MQGGGLTKLPGKLKDTCQLYAMKPLGGYAKGTLKLIQSEPQSELQETAKDGLCLWALNNTTKEAM